MPVQVTIIGLGQIGTSIGLALAKIKDQVTRLGNDREPSVARQAEKLGAVDKTVVNLPSAVREADVVILAMPVDEIRETMEIIAQDLKPGCVLIDTSPIKGPVMEWAKELLPADDRYFVSMTPTLNPAYLEDHQTGPENAHADLFQHGLVFITSMPGIDESALTLATNIASVLGATAIYTDVYESDGLVANSLLMPELVSAAIVNAAIDQPGWREARKIAGKAFAQASEAAMHLNESKQLGKTAILNADNTLRMLDQVLIELREMRELIAKKDEAGLQERLEHAQQGREQWMQQRLSGDWEPKASQHVPTGGEVIGRLFGLRPKKDKDKDR